ncbi:MULTISPECIES: hypothetical protein [Streptomyces]|uniref:hypothetical protein n=1 Tax=Streptomyces TaxID=1883 RepID=UPI00201FB7F9|nr:hypothetical protein [Streptomyces sp. MCA2]MCL7496335.1 hypothetical protein [Streptomyces sp. MCA2]
MPEVLGSTIDPGDPTRHAHPTATGFEDLSEEGAGYDDSWGTFEAPARWQKLMKLLPDGYPEQSYESWTDGPVRYAKVLSRDRVVGYLWVATDEDAAGYEPRAAVGEAAFEEGVPWLLHFAKAHQAGVPLLGALREGDETPRRATALFLSARSPWSASPTMQTSSLRRSRSTCPSSSWSVRVGCRSVKVKTP